MSRTYSPEENRRGVYLTVGLIAVLSVLGLLFVAAAPQDGEQATSSEDGPTPSSEGQEDLAGASADDASDFATQPVTEPDGGEPTAAVAAPEDLSFVCDTWSQGESADVPAEERGAMEAAAREFVLAAYGDPGSDPAAYEKRVNGLVVDECFSGSPAADYVENGEGMAAEGGMSVAPVDTLDDTTFAGRFVLFDPTNASSVEDDETAARFTRVEGEAVWVSEESDGSGDVGKQQTLTLVKQDGGDPSEGWKVSGGQIIPPPTYMDPEYQNELPPGAE